MNKQRMKLALVAFAAVAVALVTRPLININADNPVAVAAIQADSPQDRPITSLRDLSNAFVEIASEVKPAVVTVFTEKHY